MPSGRFRRVPLILLFPFICSTLLAQVSDAIGTASLSGLNRFSISVGELNPDVRADGLSALQLVKNAGLRLGAAGISILPERSWFDSTGSAELYLEVNTLKYGGTQYAYSLTLTVIQKVALSAAAGRQTLAETWSASAMGVVGSHAVAGTVTGESGALVDRLIVAYRSANRAAAR